MEKAVKTNTDSLWTRFQEKKGKFEKLLGDRTQKVTCLIYNLVSKDLPMMLEKAVTKEMAAAGPAVVRSITLAIEKTTTRAIVVPFQVKILKT